MLPQVGLGAGWGMSILICLITGCISYYTAYLIVLHLGSGTQIKDCILSRGDSVEPGAAFRAFRGRDARIEPMLRDRGLI